MDDANFAIDTANAAILALFVEEAWVQEMLQAKYVMRWGRSVYSSVLQAKYVMRWGRSVYSFFLCSRPST